MQRLYWSLLVVCCLPLVAWAGLDIVRVPIVQLADCSSWTSPTYFCQDSGGDLWEYSAALGLRPVGSGASTPTWEAVMGVGNIYTGANGTSTAVTITRDGGTACSTEAGWRQYITAGNVPTLEACDASGNLLTQDFAVYSGQNFSITIDNGASTQVSCYDVGDDGKITVADTESCGFFSRPLRDITAATYPMTGGDCGNIIYNADADALQVDLIADPTGCMVCFYEAAAGAMTLVPNGTDTITLSGTATSAGEGVVLASGIDNNVCLHGQSTSNWRVLLGVGAVTEQTP